MKGHRRINAMNYGNLSHSAQVTESYWPADRSEPLLDVTLGQLLRQAALEVPDRIALVEGCPDASSHRRWTYAQLLLEAERVASALLTRFQPGERIAVWAPNIPEWELLQLGASLAGMVLVTVNPAFKAQELTYVLRQSRAMGLFYLEEYRGNNMTAILSQARADLSDLREVVGFAGWQDFVESASPSAQLPDVRPDDAVQIQYTSGTTGFPKGAILHHRGITNNARLSAQAWGGIAGDVWVNPMPLFHV